jgi:diguanylate cyclase (GGDEF)-like protein/PAS domain S-box-containing protein
MIGVGQDLTDELAASQQVRETEQRFGRVFDQSPVAMALVSPDLHIQQANAALERLLGYEADELVGLTLADVTHPEDLDADVGEAKRMLGGEIASYQMQKRFLRKDGGVVVGRLTGTAVLDESGQIVSAIGTVEDLTAVLGAFSTIQDQKERMAATLESIDVATWDLDLVTMRQTVSDNYAEILGISFDEVPSTFDEVMALVHPDDVALFLDPTPDEDAVADRFDVEFRMVRPRGGVVWVGCKGSFVRNDGDDVIGIHGIMTNLTRRRAVEIRRVEAEQRYRDTIAAANDAFAGIDGEGRVSEWNAAAERMFGWTAEEIIGQPVMDTLVPEDRREGYAAGLAMWLDLLRDGEPLPDRWEMSGQHRDGRVFAVEMSVIASGDEGGAHIRGFVRDITERRAHQQRLAEQAVTDHLTGLGDRSVLLDRLKDGLGRISERGGAVAVLFLDVDRFKQVNDELGHDAGDRLLVGLADRLRGAVRPTDTIARIGGDEFAVVCADLPGTREAERVADRILRALEDPLAIDGHELLAAVSIGIAAVTDASVDPEAVIHDADTAMYTAKKAGGRRHTTFTA